jgi:twinkle protein
MAEFLRHTACDSCGSSDANAVYSDGKTYCFSCEATGSDDGEVHVIPTVKSGELGRLNQRWAEGEAVAIADRNLTSTYVKKFGVFVEKNCQYYPYFKHGDTEPCGYKVRTMNPKSFKVVGDIKEAGMFGHQLWGNHKQHRVVVTEGELDAIAALQMMDGKVPVVSLRSGASGAGRDAKTSYQFLDGFEEIIFCPDADSAGQEAVTKIADVFAGKLRIMKLDPRVGKDACDYLKNGKKSEFSEAYWAASQFVPEGVLNKDKLLEVLLTPSPDKIGDYPWDKLNDLTFGFRPTELVTLCAGSGLGKSSVLREIVMHIKNTTDARIGCLFMEEAVKRTAEGFMSIDLNTPLHLPTSPIERGSQAYLDAFSRVYGDDRLFIMDASFDTGATVDQVISRVRYMAKALDCNVIILDHISLLVSGGQHGDERRTLDEIMTKLRTLTQDTGIVLFAVSHLRRPDGKGHEEGAVTSVAHLRGSASIAQLSDFVIGLERNGQADDATERNTTKIRVLKNRFSGITGPAGYLLYDTDTGRLHEYTPEEVL